MKNVKLQVHLDYSSPSQPTPQQSNLDSQKMHPHCKCQECIHNNNTTYGIKQKQKLHQKGNKIHVQVRPSQKFIEKNSNGYHNQSDDELQQNGTIFQSFHNRSQMQSYLSCQDQTQFNSAWSKEPIYLLEAENKNLKNEIQGKRHNHRQMKMKEYQMTNPVKMEQNLQISIINSDKKVQPTKLSQLNKQKFVQNKRENKLIRNINNKKNSQSGDQRRLGHILQHVHYFHKKDQNKNNLDQSHTKRIKDIFVKKKHQSQNGHQNTNQKTSKKQQTKSQLPLPESLKKFVKSEKNDENTSKSSQNGSHENRKGSLIIENNSNKKILTEQQNMQNGSMKPKYPLPYYFTTNLLYPNPKNSNNKQQFVQFLKQEKQFMDYKLGLISNLAKNLENKEILSQYGAGFQRMQPSIKNKGQSVGKRANSEKKNAKCKQGHGQRQVDVSAMSGISSVDLDLNLDRSNQSKYLRKANILLAMNDHYKHQNKNLNQNEEKMIRQVDENDNGNDNGHGSYDKEKENNGQNIHIEEQKIGSGCGFCSKIFHFNS